MIPTHLKVLTIVERPFIYIRNKTFGVACAEEEDRGGWVECPEYVVTGGATRAPGGSFCCRGYCMDLLAQLSATCNFTYSLHVSLAGDYGNLERNNETGKQVESNDDDDDDDDGYDDGYDDDDDDDGAVQEWTGLIGELVEERADLILAPLTINPERAQVMEFSKPFKYQGITILQKRVSYTTIQFCDDVKLYSKLPKPSSF